MNSAYFVTGTDTEVGKTFATCVLLEHARRQGIAATGLKPIAAGTDADGHNEDVEAIRAAAGVALPDKILNPFCFRAAIAPHLAAHEEGRAITFAPIEAALAAARRQAALVLVEGVGGFRVPLGPDGDSADLAARLALPVILVVGLRLGCINHALLTAEAVAARGLTLAGWIANRIDPAMARADENLATLTELLPAPRLGAIPHIATSTPAAAADLLRLPD
jgi:dethiobiotin synthetase